MNEWIIAEDLQSHMGSFLLKWSKQFLHNASKLALPVAAVRPDALTRISNNLLRLIEGEDLENFRPLRQSQILLRTRNVCSKLPLLVELFISFEEVFRSELLSSPCEEKPRSVEAFDARLQFEHISGSLHLLFELLIDSYCEECAAPVRQSCADLLKKKPLQEVLHSYSTPHESLPATSDLEQSLDRQFLELSELSEFLQSHSHYLQNKWLNESNFRNEPADVANAEELVSALYNLLEGNTNAAAPIARVLGSGHMPNQEFKSFLQYCHLGEETISLFLAETSDNHLLRAQLNKAFHVIVRTFASSSCSNCRRRLDEAVTTLATL